MKVNEQIVKEAAPPRPKYKTVVVHDPERLEEEINRAAAGGLRLMCVEAMRDGRILAVFE